ncbi:hypothetical protein R75461_07304 [Paraburkholderia nemoris]|uniref:type 1 fimbrial protein n=1 Tax=Paraburkholderia nemoris TaxID=2793076 RepID=UPI00190C5141|nr:MULTISPECIES: type 1 fimbrial protein [Paraburkholderia]MBK3786044.1 type 1 fimbrial protein [Paraburkholderia aspalathi]CAE6847274.1 hypothetical protein R75461_07304 [Paraburkholderia nemoris]
MNVLQMIRYVVVSFAFLTSCAAHALGGTITFSGMVMAPMCSFDVAQNVARRPAVQTVCSQPASGTVSFVDTAGTTLRTVAFTQASRQLETPRAATVHHIRHLIVVVTYR